MIVKCFKDYFLIQICCCPNIEGSIVSLRSYCKSIVLALLCAFSSGLLAANSSQIKLLFNDPNDFSSPEPSCSSDLCSALLAEIQSAKKSIDFAIYGMRGQKAIFNALLAAKDRGVKLRGVVDKDTENKNLRRI